MTGKKTGAYGAASHSDPSFRKTWNREEFAKKAAEREEDLKAESKARYEAKAAGKAYHRRASTPENAKETESRQSRLNVASQVGKQTLVPAGNAIGKRGKGAGFYCDVCDLTFKDNLQFVDHLNSKQHLSNAGETGDISRATVEDVRERLAHLKRKKEEALKDEVVDLDARLKTQKDRDDAEREEKRRKRREQRKSKKNHDDEDEKMHYDKLYNGVISRNT